MQKIIFFLSSGSDALLPPSPFPTICSTRQNIIWLRSNNVLIREVFNGFHLHRMQVYKFHTPNNVANVASKRYYHMTFFTKKYTQTRAETLGPIYIQLINHVFFLTLSPAELPSSKFAISEQQWSE